MLFGLTAVQEHLGNSKWHNAAWKERWCFVAAYDEDDARRIAAEKLTPGAFKSPWRDQTLTTVHPASGDGPMPPYGWVGDIAGEWSA
jgi:hypothetical protein